MKRKSCGVSRSRQVEGTQCIVNRAGKCNLEGKEAELTPIQPDPALGGKLKMEAEDARRSAKRSPASLWQWWGTRVETEIVDPRGRDQVFPGAHTRRNLPWTARCVPFRSLRTFALRFTGCLRMDPPVLQVTSLSKSFGEVHSVVDVSLEVGKGEILGLLGANGAGKTTAINMILGIISPTAGSVRVFGEDLHAARIKILSRMNFCSTYTQLPGNLRVWQNLKVFGQIYRVPNLPRRIDEVLEMLEISPLKNRISGELSAGEGTRLNLCKALLNRPELLLLDEPTASLDPDIADKVRKVVSRIREEEGTSILYTSHNMRDVEEVCDRIVFMHRGKILFSGTAEETLTHFEEDSLEEVFIRVARSGDIESRKGEVAP